MKRCPIGLYCLFNLLFLSHCCGIRHVSFKRHKHKKHVSKPTIMHGRNMISENINLESCREITYTCAIELGTPAQTMDVILDTGSADFWVFVSGFDNTLSSSYAVDGEKFSISYADGTEVIGTLAEDRLRWGGLDIPSQVFAEIDEEDAFNVVCFEAGLLGLALDGLAHSQAPSPFHNLVLLDLIDQPIFSVHLVDDAGGTFTLGGYDSSHFKGDLKWFPLAELSQSIPLRLADDGDDVWQDDEYMTGHLKHWSIKMHHVIVDEELEEIAPASTALIDTGTTRVILPQDDFVSVATALELQCWFTREEKADDNEAGYFILPCSTVLDSTDNDQKTKSKFFFALGPCADGKGLTFYFGQGEESFHLSGDDLAISPETCSDDEFLDCMGQCVEPYFLDWVGDGQCDDGSQGFSLNCQAFQCDGGDCSGDHACDMGDPGEVCELGLEPGSSYREHWTFGDVFLRRLYASFDYGEGRIGLAYGRQDTEDRPALRECDKSKGCEKSMKELLPRSDGVHKEEEPHRLPDIVAGLMAYLFGALVLVSWRGINSGHSAFRDMCCYYCDQCDGGVDSETDEEAPQGFCCIYCHGLFVDKLAFQAVESDDGEGANNESKKWVKDIPELRECVHFSASFVLFTATFFWCWALRNVMLARVKLDLGLISFPFVIFAHAAGLASTRLHRQHDTQASRDAMMIWASVYSLTVHWAHFIVACNYAIGEHVLQEIGLKVYCGTGVLVWTGSGIWFYYLSQKWRIEVLQSGTLEHHIRRFQEHASDDGDDDASDIGSNCCSSDSRDSNQRPL